MPTNIAKLNYKKFKTENESFLKMKYEPMIKEE